MLIDTTLTRTNIYISDTATGTVSIYADDPFEDMMQTLKMIRAQVQKQIDQLKASKSKTPRLVVGQRVQWGPCRRCGYTWFGRSQEPPQHCSRCHSRGWRFETTHQRARKTTDTPNPNWYTPINTASSSLRSRMDAPPRAPDPGDARVSPPPPPRR
jgi:predicted Zn-ribbon and HTH transcriptional regulator